MALVEDIQALTARTLSALGASHDYHTFTTRVWRLLQDIVKEGRKFNYRNPATGTRVDEQGLRRLAQLYVRDYLMRSTFGDFVTLFEEFVFGLLRCWLMAYPASLSRKQIDLGTVLQVADTNAIVMAVVDRELTELKYERIAEWFAYLDRSAGRSCAQPPRGGRPLPIANPSSLFPTVLRQHRLRRVRHPQEPQQ